MGPNSSVWRLMRSPWIPSGAQTDGSGSLRWSIPSTAMNRRSSGSWTPMAATRHRPTHPRNRRGSSSPRP